MKKLVMMLAVLGLLMTFPAAAGAKKPPGQEPFPGLTCQAWFESHDDTLWQVGIPGDFPVDDGDFLVTLTLAQPAACIDVSSLEGVWNFEIEAAGVASFNMQIKDSVPGDICWRDAWSNKKTDLPDFLSTPGAIPKATVNACPGDDFTDGGFALPEPTIDHPLVFMVGYSPDRRFETSSLTITVDLP